MLENKDTKFTEEIRTECTKIVKEFQTQVEGDASSEVKENISVTSTTLEEVVGSAIVSSSTTAASITTVTTSEKAETTEEIERGPIDKTAEKEDKEDHVELARVAAAEIATGPSAAATVARQECLL